MYYINPVHKLLHTMTDFIIRDATSDALVHDQCVSNRVMTDFVRIFKTFVRVHAANDFYDSDTLPRPANQQTECVLATMLYEYEARFPNDNIFTDFPIVHPPYFTRAYEYTDTGSYSFWEWSDRDTLGIRPINVPLAEQFVSDFVRVLREKESDACMHPLLDELYTVYLALECELVAKGALQLQRAQEEQEEQDELDEIHLQKLEDVETLKIQKVVRRFVLLRDQFVADFEPAMLLAEYITILQDEDAMNIAVQYPPMVTQMRNEISAILDLVDERTNRIYYIATTVRYDEYSDVSKRIIDEINTYIDAGRGKGCMEWEMD